MKKILILGASELQLPAILEANKMGVHTIVVDYDANAVGRKFAHKFYEKSTLDEAAIYEIAVNEQIDGILTICSDRPMTIVASIGKKLGLSTITCDAAVNATKKDKMREVLDKNNIPIPQYTVCRNKNDYMRGVKNYTLPVIVKPSDNSGSRGIYLLEKMEELDFAYNYSYSQAKNKIVLIEEFMNGPECSVEIFVYEGTPYVIQVTDKITSGAPHFVELGHHQPSRYSNNEEIKRVAISAVKALGIKIGPAHVELIITDTGPKIVEVGARLGGDFITTDLVPLSTGVDMVRLTIESSLGMKSDLDIKKRGYCEIHYITERINQYAEILGSINVESLIRYQILEDTCCKCIESSNDRSGYYILFNKDEFRLKNDFNIINNSVKND